ncbi:MAG: DUF2357 domain-containing protein [Verrucomicrobiota bacterium]
MCGLAREATVPCRDVEGRLAGVLRLVQADRKSDSIRILSAEEARQHGEESVQLLEGRSYDFELLNARGKLRLQANGVVKPSSIRPTIGRIDTGVETGLLHLVLEDAQTNAPVARGAVEVLSAKINYREDYRGMLSFIADECSELLFDIRATARMRLAPKFRPGPHNLQRQLEFLGAELTSRDFVAALQRVTAMPHQKLQVQWEECGISRLHRGGRDLARQIGSATDRVPVPPHSIPAQAMRALGIADPSLPRAVSVRRQVDSLDTPENRFVKYVLTHFRDFLKRIEAILKGSTSEDRQRLVRTVHHLQKQLNAALSADLFKGVAAPNSLPLGSPVLQRKGGYREIYLAWLKFDLASELVWKGGEDVYGAGKRDMGALYEYWLFFQLLRLFRDKFELAAPPARTLFEHTDGGLNLRLKVNEPLGIQGRCVRHARRLNVRFHYNLTHERSDSRNHSGSWTRRMRPDFTLSFWPEGFSLDEAESQELTVHIHFDAKYRVENVTELFGEVDDDLSEEKAQQKRGNYKRVDLLKMHAYRDAIRRSEGAYIIYPGGANGPARFQGFHEILPGLGAFALKPGARGEAIGLQHLSRFVDEVIVHVCNRGTAREQGSYHRFHVYRSNEIAGGLRVESPLPERDSVENERPVPPAEHSVVVGWCDSERQLDWIRHSGLYNFRAGLRRGSIRMEPAIADARHLLLHGHGNRAWPGLWRIMKRGPRIFTAEELLRNGYPVRPDMNVIYAVFDVEPDSFYAGWKWDYAKLPGKKPSFGSAGPFAVRLVDVLAIHRV